MRAPSGSGDLAIPPMRGALRWKGVSLYEVTDGRIQTVDYYVDRLQAAEQLVKPVALVLAT